MQRIALFFLGLVFLAAPAAAQKADFDLVNETGYPIRELYVSPTKARTWGDDQLGRHIIEPREQWLIATPLAGGACNFDIRIVFDDDGSDAVWENFNLCRVKKITLTYNRRSGETIATYE